MAFSLTYTYDDSYATPDDFDSLSDMEDSDEPTASELARAAHDIEPGDVSEEQAEYRREVDSYVDEDDEPACPGHESLRGDLMGASDFCDGRCQS